MTRRRPAKHKMYSTKIEEHALRGTAATIAERCETLGKQYDAEKDNTLAERFYQTADHYRRVHNNEQATTR